MQTFRCQRCGQTVFFENTQCGACGARLAFDAERLMMRAFEVTDQGPWRTLDDDRTAWRPCANDVKHGACNWAVPADSPHALCASCRLTAVIPPLHDGRHLQQWRALESAKRRLLYTLWSLGLPVPDRRERPTDGLVFHFKASPPQGPAVMTGHAQGCITVNVAEADDAEREAIRTRLREPYRTLLGHLRHEVGHFYWDRIVGDQGWHDVFRLVFGDERQDYGEALKRHYEQGPPADWSQRHVSSYAASHPWEDWAETFAHYLHIVDALDTASHWQAVMLATPDDPSPTQGVHFAPVATRMQDFRQQLVQQWVTLAMFLNSMGRSLGQGDLYPFVLPNAVLDKLTLVHSLVHSTMLRARTATAA